MNNKNGNEGFVELLDKVQSFGYTDVIFDLDGTLVDSAPGILETVNYVLDSQGILPVRPVDHTIVGPPLDAIFEQLLAAKDRGCKGTLIEKFKSFYDQEGYKNCGVFCGVETALLILKEKKITSYIATNKRLLPTIRLLRYKKWELYFKTVYAIDSHGQKFTSKSDMLAKLIRDEKLEKGNVIYVGDTANDKAAAEANYIGFSHASWGYGSALM